MGQMIRAKKTKEPKRYPQTTKEKESLVELG